MNSTFTALFCYPIWLFIGLFGVAISSLNLHSKSKTKSIFGRIGLALGISLVIVPIIWLPSARFYYQNKMARVYEALDTFIVSIDETGKPPDNFQLTGRASGILNDVSKDYEIRFIDELLSTYEMTVVFDNGTRYYFAISEYRKGWNFYWDFYVNKQKQ